MSMSKRLGFGRCSAGMLLLSASVAMTSPPSMAHVHAPSLASGYPNARSALPVDPLLFHVHGLAFSPDGKSILVPSHTGLAVFRDGSWSEVNGPIHDFAGFSLAENAIYASGHPPEGSALPDPLGLVRSTDGGETWQPLALGGEADFHWIAAGYRSRALYVLSPRPNSAMPEPGLYVTRDEAKTWRRAAARGLEGDVSGIAAHPQKAEIVAMATSRGLYLSRDGGDSFRLFTGRLAVTAIAFDLDGKHVRYAHAVRRELIAADLDGRSRAVIRLPPIGLDYATHVAQSPADARVLAIATDRRHVFLTNNAGKTWRQIAKDGELP